MSNMRGCARASYLAEALERRTLLAFSPVGPEFRVNETIAGGAGNARVAMDASGSFAVAWDGFLRLFDATGRPRGGEIAAKAQDVAMDPDGDFAVTWAGSVPGQSYPQRTYGIYAQRYNPAGVPQGGAIRVNSHSNFEVYRPAVAMDADGDFVVVWTSLFQDGSGHGVYAQRFAASGAPLGDEFRVNATADGAQSHPDVAMDRDGDFVVTWESYREDGNMDEIFAQRFTGTGAPVGGEFRVNTFRKFDQEFPALAMDADGDFVIAYDGYDGRASDIWARRYTAAGAAVGDEFSVNTGRAGLPEVAMSDTGDFAIGWDAWRDGSNVGVYGRAYTAAGAAGPEFRVNTTTEAGQHLGEIAADADGDFVFIWSGNGPGDDEGVFAQRFTRRAGNGGTPPNDGGGAPPDDGGGEPPGNGDGDPPDTGEGNRPADGGGGPADNPGTGGGTGAPGQQPTPPSLPTGLLVTLRGSLPASAMAGTRARINQFARVMNLSGARVNEPVTVRLYASADTSLDAGDVEVAAVTRKMRLDPLEAGVVRVKLADLPAAADGSYRLLARASSPTLASAPAAALSPLAVTAPLVDLSATFGAALPAKLTPGEKATLRLLVRQEGGNVPARGTVNVALYASADAAAAPSGPPLAIVPLKLRLRPGASRQYRIKFRVSDGLASTPVFLVAVIDPGTDLLERDRSNNAAVTVSRIPVG